jgi:hypothetical protein
MPYTYPHRPPTRAHLGRRDLAAGAAPFARSIDGQLTHALHISDAATGHASGGITLSDLEIRENARRPAALGGLAVGWLAVRADTEQGVLFALSCAGSRASGRCKLCAGRAEMVALGPAGRGALGHALGPRPALQLF